MTRATGYSRERIRQLTKEKTMSEAQARHAARVSNLVNEEGFTRSEAEAIASAMDETEALDQ